MHISLFLDTLPHLRIYAESTALILPKSQVGLEENKTYTVDEKNKLWIICYANP